MHCAPHFALLLGKCIQGEKCSIKPSVMCLRWLLVIFPWSDSLSNSLWIFPSSIIRRYLIRYVGVVVPVPSIAILKFPSSVRDYFGWLLSKVDMFTLYISDVDCEGCLHILTLMMWIACISSNYTLIRGIKGGFMRACTSALIYRIFFMADVLVCWDIPFYVTCSEFSKWRTC